MTDKKKILLVDDDLDLLEQNKILIESNAFPSDHYAVQSQIRFHGYDPVSSLVEMKPREGEFVLQTDDIIDFLSRQGSFECRSADHLRLVTQPAFCLVNAVGIMF